MHLPRVTSQQALVWSLLSVCLLLPSAALAADDHPPDHEGCHHGTWELGLAIGAVPLLLEDEVALGLHAHVLHAVPGLDRWKVGLGLENVFDEHGHFNVAAVVSHNVVAGLNLSVAPGLLIMKAGGQWDLHLSSHFEAIYEFDLGPIHVGPVLEYSWSRVDRHTMVGLHVGVAP